MRVITWVVPETPPELSVKVSVADFEPVVVGANFTVTLQALLLVETVEEQPLLVMEKSVVSPLRIALV